MEHPTAIDTSFDFRCDTPPGADPDRWSPSLRKYHHRLWSKPLPSGRLFELVDTTVGGYLHHQSELGEFFLSSDTVIPTYRTWTGNRQLVGILAQIDPAVLDDFQRTGYTIGAMLVFPGNQIDRQWTVNQARGMLTATIGDRLDLTLECIRRHYLRGSSPLDDVLARYRDFFGLFGDFRGYVDHFLLNDLTTDDCSSVEFFLPFDDFRSPALPQDTAQYEAYRRQSVAFVSARNRRIAAYFDDGVIFSRLRSD